MLAALVHTLRDFELAEDALQDAFAAALERWPVTGTPDAPAAWLLTVAATARSTASAASARDRRSSSSSAARRRTAARASIPMASGSPRSATSG